MAKRFYRRCIGRDIDGDAPGKYWTWKMIHVMAVLARVHSETHKVNSAKELAKITKISYKGVRDILKRLKERGFAEYGLDAEGRKAWVAMLGGAKSCNKALGDILDRRIRSTYRSMDDLEDYSPVVEKVRWIFDELKVAGWHDLQVRNIIYRVNVFKIERVIKFAKKRAKKNLGGYLWSILTNKYCFEERFRKYTEHDNFEMRWRLNEDALKEVRETIKQQRAPFRVFKTLHQRCFEKGLTDRISVGDELWQMGKEGVAKYKPSKDYIPKHRRTLVI